MPSAAWRNADAAYRERRRREALAVDSGGLYNAVSVTPEWDAFFGSLKDNEEAANAAGLNYRVDLGSIGRDGYEGMDPGGRPNNRFLAQTLASEDISRRLQAQNAERDAYNQQLQQADINDLYTGYLNHVQAGQNAPPIAPHTVTKEVSPGQPDKYTVREAATTPREALLNRVPLPIRAQYEKQFADQDLSLRKQAVEEGKLAETTRHNEATEHANDDDVKSAVEGMKAGTLPPQLPGRATMDYTKILAEAKRQGYDLATAAADWTATQKFFGSLNSTQQLRMRQAADTAYHSLDVIDDLAKQWDAGKYPVLNKAALVAAKNGVMGPKAQSIATQLSAQISDLTSELGNVYMGGNSPTDYSLSLAAKNLSEDWSKDVLLDMTKLARTNLQMRRNSFRNVQAITPSNQATPPAPPPPVPNTAGPKVGDVVSVGGKRVKISAIHPDGTFDGSEVK